VPSPGISADHRNILGNTGQNVLGLGVYAFAIVVAQVLMTRVLGAGAYGVVAQATQFAFIAAAATRFGMDVANVRLVAILAGRNEAARARGLVRRSAIVAVSVSVVFALVVFLAAGWIARTFSPLGGMARLSFEAAAIGIPLGALAFTYMGATRGLKIMRFTLYGQWIAQPILWIVFAIGGWILVGPAGPLSGSVGVKVGATTLGFSASWGVALVIAWYGWRKLSRPFGRAMEGEGIPEERVGALLRFGALRAPATLFSQLIFFTDMYVLGWLWSGMGARGAAQVGIYNATLRVGQSLFLFLTSVSLTFSPFVADLHHRREIGRLDGLYKTVTRWTLAATIPLLLILAILPGEVLRIFGKEFVAGASAMRMLIIGMIVPVMVGTVGFILIMVGRTGWDLLVYMGGFAIDIGVALVLARPESLGMRGAAIAQACTLSFSAVARLLLVRHFVHIWPFNRQFLRLAAPTIVAAVTIAGVHAVLPAQKWLVNLAGSALAGMVVYGLLVLAMGLTPTERRTLAGAVRRLTARDGSAPVAG